MAKKRENGKELRLLDMFLQNKTISIFYILLSLIQAVLSFFVLIYIAKIVEYLTLQKFNEVIKCALILFVIFIFFEILNYLKQLIYIKFKNKVLNNIENEFCERLPKISNNIYNSISSGALTTRVNSSPVQLFSTFAMVVDDIINLIMQTTAIIYIACTNYIIAIIVFTLCCIVYCQKFLITKFDRKNMNEKNDSYEKLQGKTIEFIKGNKDIKCLNLNENIDKELNECLTDYCKNYKKYDVWFFTINGISSIFLTILLGVMLYVGIVLYENLFISYFALIFLFNNYNRVNKFVNRLQQFIRRCTMVDNNKKRINQVFKGDLMPIEKFGDKNLPNFQGNIEFKDITFSYDDIDLNKKLKDDLKTKKELRKELKKNKSQSEQEQNLPKKVLQNFSLKINAGERVAFVGKSGCGKSTLVSLLSKSLSAQSGTVLLDGVDINELSESAIRDNVTVINQFPYIYFMSLRDNIKIVKPDASDEEILQACEKAYLKDFINELPFGLDTILGENGVKVSGGQKQRIAIARAFLKDTKVMVFDESTSSLDNFAQKYVQTSIDEIKNKTVIIVAHRLSTIINCDKIVFIDEGKVKAVGTFDELMANCSEFAKLYTLRR